MIRMNIDSRAKGRLVDAVTACRQRQPADAFPADEAPHMNRRTAVRCALATMLLWCSAAIHAEQHTVPLFVMSSPGSETQGVLRLVSKVETASTVAIHAIDDAGGRSGPATLTLNALAAVDLSATELQSGNAAKGLLAGLGDIVGDVRLVIDSDMPIVSSAYVRGADGTLSAMNATAIQAMAPQPAGYRYDVAVFHPASHATQPSRLRLSNPNDTEAQVAIDARDDTGAAASGGTVRLTLPPGGARSLTSQQLEAGDAAVISGRLGAGVGNWRLSVSADSPIQVVNVAVGAVTAYWSNLSTTAIAGWAPEDAASFDARFLDHRIVSRDGQDRLELQILPGNRFRDVGIEDGMEATEEGRYRYERTGRDAGRLSLESDSGDRCETNLYFASPTSGWYASVCIDGIDRVETSNGGPWLTLDAAAAALDLGSEPDDRTYTAGTAIDALTLPAAVGGEGALTYSLSPEVPGLSFAPDTRQLTGTPSEAGAWLMTYRVRDASGDTDWRYFNINVGERTEQPGSLGTCRVGQRVGIGQNCVYPGTAEAFSVNVRGRGSFLGRLAGIRINVSNETIDGRVYDFRASHQGDGVWRIDRIAGSTEPPMNGGDGDGDGGGADTSPRFSVDAAPGDRTYTVGTAIEALTLPAANGGNGILTYSLSPDVSGLSFDATTRRLTGTPSTAGTYNMTYRVQDTDGDTDSLSFTITVEDPGGGGQTMTYEVGDTLSDLPTGTWSTSIRRGGSLLITGSGVTLRLNDASYFEHDDHRYTCQSAAGCVIENRRVTSGSVVQTAKGTVPAAAVRHMLTTPGAKIVLRSVAALDCAGSVDGYRWEQVTGTAVSMDAGAEAPVIVVPDGVEGPMTFRVHASCSSGPDAVDTVSVQVVPPRVERVLSALVDFQDVDPADRPFSREDLSGLLVDDPDSLANYLAAASRGLVDVRFDVLDWLTVGRSRSAYASGAYDVIGDVIYRLSETADLTGYDKVFPAIFPLEYGDPGCAAYLTPYEYPTAQGTTPLGAAWLSGPDMGCVMKGRHAHEYGHTFGFVHSLTLDCHTETGIPVSTVDPTDRGSCKIINECANEACTEIREGDASIYLTQDPDMLGADHPRYYEDYFPMVYQAAWQAHAGWLTDEQVVTTTGSHWITSLESLSPTPKAIRLRLGADHAGGMQEYWLESRLRVPDWNEQRNSPCTAAVRLAWPNGTFDGNQLRGWDYSGHTDTLRFDWKVGATDPRSQSEFRDVRDGEAFWDPYRGVRFELTECVERDFEAALKVDVDRTTLQVDPPVVAVLENGTATVTVTNRGTSIVNVGEPTIGGRHGTAFSLVSDECRSATLGPGQTCRIGVESTAASLSFGFLQVPNDDDLAPELAVSLMVLPAGEAVGSHATPVLAEHSHGH